MIELTGVRKLYPGTTAVDGLTFTVEDGEFTVVIGPSGCGKSTTLRMINRLISASDGTIAIDGTDIRNYRPEELRRRMGYVIQSVGLFPHMSVAQNIAVVPGLLKWSDKRTAERVDELLHLFGLAPRDYRDKYPRQLSGGEAQRVGVARALAADPAILLMDEPFGALDPITREVLQTEFARIQRELKKTIVFVTHDIDEAIRLATRIVILKEGRLVQHDTPEAILSAPADRFVREFIGADRALKRLSRLKVEGFSRRAASIAVGQSLGEARLAMGESRYLWVIDGAGVVIGWLDASELKGCVPTTAPPTTAATVADAMTAASVGECGVTADSTLRDALARMMQSGIRTAPVVDAAGRLVGEVGLDVVMEA
jgi:osmoprotectant transport system ATP-binding protein